MANLTTSNIIDSNADYSFFSASSMLSPKQIHGDNETAPLQNMSAFASALYDYDNKIATVLASQLKQVMTTFQVSKRIPLMFMRLDDGRVISPFIVRRHIADAIDNRLTVLVISIIFERIVTEALAGRVFNYAIERPYDADKVYDRLVLMLPDNVTIHNEVRYGREND